MPCKDPRDDISYYDIERCRDEEQEYYDALKSEMDKLTDMTCAAFTILESAGVTAHLVDPEVRLWWEEHKKADAERLEKEKRDVDAARQKVKTAVDYITRYAKIVKTEDLPGEDKQYFTDKTNALFEEIRETFSKFPEIIKEFT